MADNDKTTDATAPAPAAPDAATAAPAAPEPIAAPKSDEWAAKLALLDVSQETIDYLRETLGVTAEEDLASITVDDLIAGKMKPIPARKVYAALQKATAPTMADDSVVMPTFVGVLPQVPNFESLLGLLKTGGVLKVEDSTVIGLVQAAIAEKADLFSLTAKLATEMLAYAMKNDEPVDSTYYALKTQLTRRNYGDLFAAIPGFDGRSVTESAKKELFKRANMHMWPNVIEFAIMLNNWQDAWVKGSNNPMAFQQMAAAFLGGRSAAMPAASMGAAPPTGQLHDAAGDVNDAANKVFAGEGIQISAAVAFDTNEIRKVLADPRLPGKIGAGNRDQMLKQLGIDVAASDERFEMNVTQYVMSILNAKNFTTGGMDELNYFNALFMLGSQIDWNRLGGMSGGVTGIGGRTKF